MSPVVKSTRQWGGRGIQAKIILCSVSHTFGSLSSGWKTAVSVSPRSRLEIQNVRTTLHLRHQDLHFNKISRWFLRSFKPVENCQDQAIPLSLGFIWKQMDLDQMVYIFLWPYHCMMTFKVKMQRGNTIESSRQDVGGKMKIKSKHTFIGNICLRKIHISWYTHHHMTPWGCGQSLAGDGKLKWSGMWGSEEGGRTRKGGRLWTTLGQVQERGRTGIQVSPLPAPGPPCLVVSAASGKMKKTRAGRNNKDSRCL